MSGDASVILDLVRVVACQMVVVCHVFSIYLLYKNIDYDDSLMWTVPNFLGPMGVILFFFVSGIVISNSLLKKKSAGNYGFGGYFIDRFSRIYSGLVPCLAIVLILDLLIRAVDSPYYFHMSPMFGTSEISAGVFLPNLLMLQMIPPFNFPRPPFAELLWTLNIEWWLYMFFGLLALSFRPARKFSLKAIPFILLFALYPAVLFLADYRGTLVFAWFFGVLITLMLVSGKFSAWVRKHFKLLFPLTLVLTVVRIIIDPMIGVLYYEYVLEFLAGCTILLAVVNFNGKKLFNGGRLSRYLKTMAGYSFTLYLLNMVVIVLLLMAADVFGIGVSLPALFVVSLVLANAVSYAVAYFTEMRYKAVAKWIKSKAGAVRVSARAPA